MGCSVEAPAWSSQPEISARVRTLAPQGEKLKQGGGRRHGNDCAARRANQESIGKM